MTKNFSRPSLDIYQAVTDKIVDLLEKGVVPWRKTWTTVHSAPKNLISGKEYQGINYFLLGCQSYDSPYWLTFKQALDRGGHVRKGERGSLCIFWKIYKKEDADAEDGFRNIPVLKHYTVFNADQCEGVDAPKVEVKTWPEHERIASAEKVQLDMPCRPTVQYGGGSAKYNSHTDTVTVPELCRFENPAEFYATLFHELAHSTGHKNRLNREGIVNPTYFGSDIYGKEELIAEMSSAFLCNHCGISNVTIENSAAYIQGWLKAIRQDKKLLVSSAAQAQKAADYILNIRRGAGAEQE